MPHLTHEREIKTFCIQVEAFKNVTIAYKLLGLYDRGVRHVVFWALCLI